ncbi:MAG: hypothetical protein Q9M91_06835 [Candidatus Dojkabacteria bacterium]|nr:hypothetical protein [Candidatus Dojkabacteria bacterium]
MESVEVIKARADEKLTNDFEHLGQQVKQLAKSFNQAGSPLIESAELLTSTTETMQSSIHKLSDMTALIDAKIVGASANIGKFEPIQEKVNRLTDTMGQLNDMFDETIKTGREAGQNVIFR